MRGVSCLKSFVSLCFGDFALRTALLLPFLDFHALFCFDLVLQMGHLPHHKNQFVHNVMT